MLKTLLAKNPKADFKPPGGVKAEDPFVLILDIATGTATFFYECIEVIERTMKDKWCKETGKKKWSDPEIVGRWNDYVPRHLLPRLYGYEIMMAPYAIAHVKLALKLGETGYRFRPADRLHIYLTDSLEPASDFADSKLADMFTTLAKEAHEVNTIKAKKLFTVILGNPPYLREKERGPGEREQRIGGWVRYGNAGVTVPLFDDFIKPLADLGLGIHAKLGYELSVIFWRLALWMVYEKRKSPGIVGMISPRAYVAGPGHTAMRAWMRKHCSTIRVADLGGDNRGARTGQSFR
ncbi:MAG: hypothetical protein M5U12_12840 [Verrucomicrobia bacterium]|nr:hypothetical protein [Verrucomicrobiota bacterium]